MASNNTKRSWAEVASSGAPFRDAVFYPSPPVTKIVQPGRSATTTSPPVKQLGENGMPEYTNEGLQSRILALSQLVRGGDPSSLVDRILSTSEDNTQEVADLIILIFVTRNARGGKGERDLSFKQFLKIWQAFPQTAAQLLRLYPHYGYWKDFLLLLVAAQASLTATEQDRLLQTSVTIMKEQLEKDLIALEAYKKELRESIDEEEIKQLKQKGPSISLLAKWLPREKSSFDQQIKFIEPFSKMMWPDITVPEKTKEQESEEERRYRRMFPDAKMDTRVVTAPQRKAPGGWESTVKTRYRKTVAELTSFLALPEVLLAAKREEEIQFHMLASKATLRLRKVFLNEDKRGETRSRDPKRIRLAERFREYVSEKGLKGKQIMPHEIVSIIRKNRNISKGEEEILDSQWKNLWQGVVTQVEESAKASDLAFNPTRMVPMADVSPSMKGTPMEVSIALSIGLSEITHDAFKHMILTFHSTPTWHRLDPTATIVEKVRSLEKAAWGMSTNFEAAYELILDVVEKAKLSREDMPSLIVFSDMQFNEARGQGARAGMTTMHDVIREKVKRVAGRLEWEDSDPTPIVYWNLRNTGGHPVDKNTQGAVLLSGFSPSLLKLVMQGEALQETSVEIVQEDGTVVTKKIQVTPEEILRKMLDDKLYDPVREILANSEEGKLRDYKVPCAEKGIADEGFELI